MTYYLERSYSYGPGTLIFHDVWTAWYVRPPGIEPQFDDDGFMVDGLGKHHSWMDGSDSVWCFINEARYNEFIAIHGGTRAV